jgi:hypothetical protein
MARAPGPGYAGPMTTISDDHACPACGGSGGGPFGRPGSAWDVEDYVCPRCRGLGFVAEAAPSSDDARVVRPGIAKTAPPAPATGDKKRRSSGAS